MISRLQEKKEKYNLKNHRIYYPLFFVILVPLKKMNVNRQKTLFYAYVMLTFHLQLIIIEASLCTEKSLKTIFTHLENSLNE